MAENKKSFVLYCDLISTVRKMKKEDAGELLMHILQYVNDENPITENMVVDLVFEPIKLQMKRDLKKWEGILETKSMSGRIGNLKRWYPNLYEQYLNKEITLEDAEIIADAIKCDKVRQNLSQTIPNIAVTDTVTVTDTVIKKNINIAFDLFWNLYDKKVDRKNAELKWGKLTDEERLKAMEHIPKYINANPDKQFRKNPDSYITNKSFNDEIIGLPTSQLSLPIQEKVKKEYWEIHWGHLYKTKEEFMQAVNDGLIDY